MASPTAFSAQRLRQLEVGVLKVVLVTVLVFGLGAVWLGWREGWSAFAQVSGASVLVLLLATVLENALRLYRYRLFSRALALPVPFRWITLYYLAGMALIPTPGKVGTALRLWLLNTHHGLSYARTAPMLIMDVLTDTLAMGLLVSLGLLFLPHPELMTVGGVFLLSFLVGVFVLLEVPSLGRRSVKLLHRLLGRRWPKLAGTLLKILRIIHTRMGWRVLLPATALSFLSWAAVGLALTWVLHQAGATVPWPAGPVALCASSILGFLSLMPGGMGGAEASLAGLLHLFGTPLGLALVATVLGRIAVLWLPVAVGFAVLPWALRGPRR
jgi:glycosyltransferase 2 family protein